MFPKSKTKLGIKFSLAAKNQIDFAHWRSWLKPNWESIRGGGAVACLEHLPRWLLRHRSLQGVIWYDHIVIWCLPPIDTPVLKNYMMMMITACPEHLPRWLLRHRFGHKVVSTRWRHSGVGTKRAKCHHHHHAPGSPPGSPSVSPIIGTSVAVAP